MPQEENNQRPTYRIGQLSKLTGVKAGTIRFYEKCGFLGSVERTPSQYRIYHRQHIYQIRVCRLVFGGFVNKRLRKESRKILDASARWDFVAYGEAAANYQKAIEEDIERTRKAIAISMEQMEQKAESDNRYTKVQAATMVGVTPEAIRNWERNGLLGQHKPYQKRFYEEFLVNRMYVIRLLLDTGYSMMAIRGFVQNCDSGALKSAEQLLIAPKESEELRYRSDRYLEALLHLREKARQLMDMKKEMEKEQ